MRPPPFPLERYFARWEFTATHLLGSSDAEGMRMDELLALADEETAALWRDLKLGYTESRGHPLLRREIARLYEGVAEEEVLTFTGAEEAIFSVLGVTLSAGDHAVVTWPAYTSLLQVARTAGAEVTPLPLVAEGGAWRMDLAALERALRPDTRMLVLNFPHNPTGALPDRAAFAAAVELARARGARLFSDEVYRLMEHDGAERLPAAVEVDRRAVSLGVMSKSFGLAGLRVGWIATHDLELLEEMAAFKDYLTICSSAPSEVLALIALRAREKVLERTRKLTAAGHRAADELFGKWKEWFRWIPPRGGTVAFPEWMGSGTVDELADALVQEEGVLIVPGRMFDHPGRHFRVGLARAAVPEAFERFDRFLRRRRAA
ncbi:MAG TPA: aminotransferase class I/II-fold pyridoxal phosphate-dependent enzyme [Myxococcales bacterium]|nr:aminotransferase class I/II-fold pyridoxal phosphate-dependent enzyme [Myxococcales bacterium]